MKNIHCTFTFWKKNLAYFRPLIITIAMTVKFLVLENTFLSAIAFMSNLLYIKLCFIMVFKLLIYFYMERFLVLIFKQKEIDNYPINKDDSFIRNFYKSCFFRPMQFIKYYFKKVTGKLFGRTFLHSIIQFPNTRAKTIKVSFCLHTATHQPFYGYFFAKSVTFLV